jgi:hypothetical protein
MSYVYAYRRMNTRKSSSRNLKIFRNLKIVVLDEGAHENQGTETD